MPLPPNIKRIMDELDLAKSATEGISPDVGETGPTIDEIVSPSGYTIHPYFDGDEGAQNAQIAWRRISKAQHMLVELAEEKR